MCDQVHGFAGAERLDLPVESGCALVDVLAPVEAEGPDVPARVELQQERQIGLAMHARDPHVGSRLRGAPVVLQLEICDPAGDEADEVDPDPVGIALAVDRVELGAHDPGKHENLAELAASHTARRRASRARERLVSHLLCEESLVLRVEVDHDPADRRDVTAVERLLQRLEPGRLGTARHGLTCVGAAASGGRARRCVRLMRRSIASGGSSATCPLSMSLSGHLAALVTVVK